MLDLAKSFLLIPIYLTIFLFLGTFILRMIKENFSFSLAVLSGFFSYHLLFCIVALPCILTQQTLTSLIRIWLPILAITLTFSAWIGLKTLFFESMRFCSNTWHSIKSHLSSLMLPMLAVCFVLILLYLSVCSYYVGWDTAFYIRTTLHAVENDSMYTIDAATGQLASVLSLRYALSPFYMNSAIICRLTNLHPLLVQNLTDGSICVILALIVIYRIGLLAFNNDHQKACIVVVMASVIHLSHVSVFSPSDFLLLRSYEAKAYCCNIVLPFIGYVLIQLWTKPEKKSFWFLLFLSVSASIPISMSSLLTVPTLVTGSSLIWIIRRNWSALKNTALCMLINLLFIGAYFLEAINILTIPLH